MTYGGRVWHLWMEAGGSWQRYGASSLYRSLTTALRAQTRPLAPDLMLILPGEAAFIIECKYSANPDYVGRTGLAQTLLYMTDVGASMAASVEGVVVAPNGIAGDITSESTPAGRLGIASPSAAVRAGGRVHGGWPPPVTASRSGCSLPMAAEVASRRSWAAEAMSAAFGSTSWPQSAGRSQADRGWVVARRSRPKAGNYMTADNRMTPCSESVRAHRRGRELVHCARPIDNDCAIRSGHGGPRALGSATAAETAGRRCTVRSGAGALA